MKGALFTKKTLGYLRNILMERRKRLVHAVESGLTPSSGGHRGGGSTDLLDAAIDSSTHDLAFEIAAVGATEVQSIDRALRRMEEGSYGVCNECGLPIAEARMRALPFAELCVKCQAGVEKTSKEPREGGVEGSEYSELDAGGDSEGDSVRIRGRKVG
jgi:DnaK suppressor protein